MAMSEIKHDFRHTKGLNLFLPPAMAATWEKEHKTDDARPVKMQIPLNMLRSLFETLAALTTDDVATILGRWTGMTPHIATLMNADLTAFVKILYSQGMRTRWKPAVEPHSWRLSREMGWDQVKR